MPVRYGTGSAQLPTFVHEGALFVQFDCVGKGSISIHNSVGAIVKDAACSNTVSTVITTDPIYGPYGFPGAPMSLDVSANPSTVWEVFIAQGGTIGLPPLGGSAVPADSQILVPVTYRAGSATLLTFTPREHYIIESACIGPGAFELVASHGSVIDNGGCGSWNGPTGTPRLYPPNEILGEPLTIRVNVDPSSIWEILIVESASPTPSGFPAGYGGFTAPPGSTVLVAATRGTGTVTLPTFRPTERFYIVTSCSAGGSLAITSQPAQGGFPVSSGCPQSGVNDLTGPADEVMGAAISLTVGAPASTSWEVLIYETNQPNGG
jgi:hypothetical protein